MKQKVITGITLTLLLIGIHVCIHSHGYVSSPDVNGDGIVNIVDIVIVALAFGSLPEDPYWNSIADLNQDGIIDIVDIVFVAIHFGETG